MDLAANKFYDLIAGAANKFHLYSLGSDKSTNPDTKAKEAQYQFCEHTGGLCKSFIDYW